MKNIKRILCLFLIALLLPVAPAAAGPSVDDLIKAVQAGTGRKIYVDLHDTENNGYGQWKKLSGDTMQFRCKIYNHHTSKTVKAVELLLYGENIWGDRVDGDTIAYTTIKKIQPGQNAYSDYITLDGRSQIQEVYVRLKRVMYTDGTIEENPNMGFYSWDISWK